MGTVCSGRRPSRLADQAGSIPASGVRSSAVPTCTADAPSASAAATPRPSPIPPAAITGTRRWSTRCGTSATSPTAVRSAVSGSTTPRCPPASNALRDHGVGARLLRGQRVVEGDGGGEPGDAALVQPFHVVRVEQPHDRRDGGGRRLEHRGALRGVGRGVGAGRAGCAEAVQERGGRGRAARVVDERVGHPDVELERPARNRRGTGRPTRRSGRGHRAAHHGAPIPPASATAIASSGELAPAIGASRIGSARP